MFANKKNETHKSPVTISKNFRKLFMFKIIENILSLEKIIDFQKHTFYYAMFDNMLPPEIPKVHIEDQRLRRDRDLRTGSLKVVCKSQVLGEDSRRIMGVSYGYGFVRVFLGEEFMPE